MSNSFNVYGGRESLAAFLKSTINSCDTVIQHYDFVLSDISSNISNPHLEATKGPTIAFLKKMRSEWEKTRSDAVTALKELSP